MSRWPRAAALAFALTALAGCLPGSQTGVAPPTTQTPSDEVLVNLLRSIEERRADQFVAAISQTCNPDRDVLYTRLTEFLKNADYIEYTITVDRRDRQPIETTYVFQWQRRHQNRDTGETLNAQGRSEWTISKASGRFLLEKLTGDDLF